MAWPPTPQEVVDLLRIKSQSPADAGVLASALDAAVADVTTWRGDLFGTDENGDPLPEPDPNVHHGTVMYAGHLYSNRVNVTGVDPVTDLGGGPATFLPAIIQRLLGISTYAKPRVG